MADFIPLWQQRITDAQAFQALKHPAWQHSLSLFDMSYWASQGWDGTSVESCVPVNYATTFVNTLLAGIYARNPKMFAEARQPLFARFAATMQDLLAQHWDEGYLQPVMEDVVLDAIIFGHGWFEIGYAGGPAPQVAEPTTEENGVFASLRQRLTTLLGAPARPLATQGDLEERKDVGELYGLRRSPWDVLWPPGYHDYWTLPYLIVHERLFVEDFLNNPGYRHKDRWLAGAADGQQKQTGEAYYRGTWNAALDRQTVDVFHVWDRRAQLTFTLSMESPQPHAEPMDWPYHADGFPQRLLQFNRVPNSKTDAHPFGFGDLEPIFGQILELSKLRQQMVAHRERATAIILVQQGTTTEDKLRSMAGAQTPYELIPVPNIQATQVVQGLSIPPALFQTENAIKSDLDRDSGLQLLIADLARTGDIERATVAQIAQSSAQLKTGFRVHRIERFFQSVARYQSGLLWQFMDKYEVGDRLGVVPDEAAWPPLPDDPQAARRRIRRELELRIEAGSTQPIQNSVLDREQYLRALTIIQATAPDIFQTIKRPAIAELIKKFQMPSLEQLVLNASSEQSAEAAQEENQLLLQGHPQMVDVCEDHQTHLRIHAQLAMQLQQQGQSTPLLDQHILQHSQLQGQLAGPQRNAQQGQRQSAQANSPQELLRAGTPEFSDVMGQAMNLRAGTGAQSVGA